MNQVFTKRPTALLIFILICNLLKLDAQQYVQLGSGTTVTDDYEPSPINIYYRSLHGQIIYTKAELNAAGFVGGNIQSLGFYVEVPPLYDLPNYTIKMKHTGLDDTNIYDSGPFNTVLTIPSYAPTPNGFDQLMLDAPFRWNGVDNILIDLCFEQVPDYTATGTVRYYSAPLYGFNYAIDDSESQCPLETYDNTGNKPQIRLGISGLSPNDAGVVSLLEPYNFCPGNQDISLRIGNFGNNVIDTVAVNWSLDGIAQTPIQWTTTLDTLGGTGNSNADITLGNQNFVAGQLYNLKAWTATPNNQLDTVNINDTLQVSLQASLQGTYTIGGTSPDYPSLNLAVADLAAYGLCGPVVFNIRDGVYNEQVLIPAISGSSATNSMTFQSESGDSTAVSITSSSSSADNYTIGFSGASYVYFKQLSLRAINTSYGNVVRFRGEANNNKISNCVLEGPLVTTTSSSMAIIYSDAQSGDFYNNFSHNVLLNGSYGMYIYGQDLFGGGVEFAPSNNGSNNFNGSSNSTITVANNNFVNQYRAAIQVIFHTAPIIHSNTITTNSSYTSFYGTNLENNTEGFCIEKNTYSINAGYGVRIYYNEGTTPDSSYVANNFISINGTSTATGIYLYYADYVGVYFNNVNITSTYNNTNASAIYLYGGNFNQIKNNNLVNTGASYAAYLSNFSNLDFDYNNLYTTSTVFAYTGQNFADLAALQAAGYNTNGAAVNPNYTSISDLHVNEISLNKTGTPLSFITEDIDGEFRNPTNPDIGADEFLAPALDIGITAINSPSTPFPSGNSDVIATLRNLGEDTITTAVIEWAVNGQLGSPYSWTGSLPTSESTMLTLGSQNFEIDSLYDIAAWSTLPNSQADLDTSNDSTMVNNLTPSLNGIYTIGGTTPDYATLNAAVSDLTTKGISGSVTFNVRDGIYQETITLIDFPGAGCGAEVIFQSESGDSTAVTITRDPASVGNFTLALDGVDGLTFKHLTFSSGGPYQIIQISNGADCNKFLNNQILGYTTSSTSTSYAAIYSPRTIQNLNLEFRNNRFANGSYAFYYLGNTSHPDPAGLVIANNHFENQFYRSLYIDYMEATRIEENSFLLNSSYTSSNAINLSSCPEGTSIRNNKINQITGLGINFSNSDGTAIARNLIANNFVSIGGNSSNTRGIYVYNADYTDTYYNNVNITAINTSSTAYYNYSSSFNNSKNNNFIHNGGGYAAYYISNTPTADHNNYYTTGDNLFYFNSNYPNLFAWQTTNAQDANSIAIDPTYTNVSDLHVSSIDLNGAGTPLAEVTTDIDGDPRDALLPDIGADEFSPPPNDAGVAALSTPAIPFAVGAQELSVLLKNFGGDSLKNVAIEWEFDGTPQSSVNWTGDLGSGDTLTVSLGVQSFAAGISYNIKAWTSLPNGAVDNINENDTLRVNNHLAALTGTYTIGGSSPDFLDFESAALALDMRGVLDSVRFLVRDGSYINQINLPAIRGVDCEHRVTFESESGNQAGVVLANSSNLTDNYTVQLNGAIGITFKNMTIEATNGSYSRVLSLINGASCNQFINNKLLAVNTASTSNYRAVVYSNAPTGFPNADNQFIGNQILEGSYGFLHEGNSTQNSTNYLLANNIFQSQYYMGININYTDGFVLQNNTIETDNNIYSSYYGMYLRGLSVTVLSNKLDIDGRYGIFASGIQGIAGSTINNNFVALNNTITTNAAYAIYLDNLNNVDVLHNSVNVNSPTAGSRAAYFYYCSNTNVFNNNFANTGQGYSVDYQYGGPTRNYNNLYAANGNLGRLNGVDYLDLLAWQSVTTAQDLNSIAVAPSFVSPSNLHSTQILLDGTGSPQTTVTEDIDGEPRNATTPDIGADEFSPLSMDVALLSVDDPTSPILAGSRPVSVSLFNNGTTTLDSVNLDWTVNGIQQAPVFWADTLEPGNTTTVQLGDFTFSGVPPYVIRAWTSLPNGMVDLYPANDTTTSNDLYVGLAGDYYIGGLNPDFNNFTEAAAALTNNGLAGAVNFIVRAGIYNENITLPEVEGNTATNFITFRSENSDSSTVTLNSSATATLFLNGVDYISFSHMGFANTLYRTVDIANESNTISFENCLFQGRSVSSTSTSYAVIYSGGSKDDSLAIRNSEIRDGSYGIYLSGAGSSNLEQGLVLEGNTIIDHYYTGILLQYFNAPLIRNNRISSFSAYTSSRGLYLAYCDNDMEVSGNTINVSAGVYGAYFSYCDGFTNRGKIFNNFTQLGGTATSYGTYFYYCTNQDYHYNSLNLDNTAATSYGLYLYYGSSINIQNSIIANTGGGYAIYSNASNNISGSNYNDLYTTGATLGYWNGDQTDLAAWRLAAGFDANSFSVDPMFATNEDLHVTQANLDGNGTPITDILLDIDGQSRNETTPDIGADEFGAGLATNDAGITAILAPTSECELDSLLTVSVRIQNFGTDTLTAFDVVYIVNDTLTVTENVGSLSIPGGTSAAYDFSTQMAVQGFNVYALYAHTQLTADSNVDNDTVVTRLIQRYPIVVPAITEDRTVCQGSYAYLYASGGSNYQWRRLPNSSIISYSSSIGQAPSDTTSYEVTVFNSFGCSAKDTATINILPRPTTPVITIFGSFSGCSGDTVTLESSVTDNISWNTGETTSVIEIYQPGYYTAYHTDSLSGCQSSSQVYLGGDPIPYVSGPSYICEGNSTTLSVVYGASYLWNTGAITQSINVSPASTTIYSVTVTTGAGCVYERSRSLIVYPVLPAPVITDITADTSICLGETIRLEVVGNASNYSWSNGYSGRFSYATPTTTTTYTVNATNGLCSSGSDSESVTVSVLPVPAPPIIVATGSTTLTFCDADSILLTSSNFPDSIVWNTGATTQSIWTFTPGTYTVYHIGANGCAKSESVTLVDPPKPYISGNTTICEGETATLVVQNGLTYNWSNGSMNQSIMVSPSSSTRYYVDVTNEAGCEYQDSVDVTVIPVPVINSITADTSVCVGEPVRLSVNGTAINYLWSNGLSGPSILVYPSATTTYSIAATNGSGCSAIANSSVTVTTLPLPNQPIITPADTLVICEGAAVNLTSSIANDIYWNGAGTNATITASAPGNYIVTHYNSLGCELSDTTTVIFPTSPTLVVGDNQPDICEGESKLLTATGGTGYLWSTGATTAAITVSPLDTTTYSTTITNAYNCTYIEAVDINVVPLGLPIGVPSNMLPNNGELNVFPPVSLSWSPSVNATKYDLYVWPTADTRPASPTRTNLTQISTVFNNLSSGTEYNWQVVARNFCDSTLGPIQDFTLRDYPDLTIADVQIPATAFSGQGMSVDWIVENTGNGFTINQWSDAVYLSDDMILDYTLDSYLGASANFSALNAGASYTNTATYNLPNGIEGTYYVFVVTDRFDNEFEADNDNNTGISVDTVIVTLTPPPDLQVTSIITPNNVFSGQNFNINYTVSNLGNGQTVSGGWIDRFYFSDTTEYNPGAATYLGQQAFSGTVKADSTYTSSFTGTIPSGIYGTYYVHVVTDYLNDEYEHAAEINNNSVGNPINVTLTPPPDLVVTSIMMPDTAGILENISISWTVENQGGTPANPYWVDRVYLSQETVQPDLSQAQYLGASSHTSTLNPFDTYTAQKTFKIPDNIVGPYYVYVFTDATDRVFEFLNNNNNISRSDTTMRLVTPDLAIDQVAGPLAANSGETVTVTWEVSNIGAADALNQNRSDQIMLSLGATFNSVLAVELDVVSRSTNLSSGGSIMEQATVMLPNGIDGQYYLYVKADAGDLIYEPNLETNNVNTNGTPITISLSPWVDLAPETTAVQDSAIAGQVIPFDYMVKNSGTATQSGGTWEDHIYLSAFDTYSETQATLLAISTRTDSLLVDSTYLAALNLSLPPTLATGYYYIYVLADQPDAIYEYNFEGNNMLRSDSIYIESYPPVDLVLQSATAPNMGASGQPFEVTWEVSNDAGVATIAPFWHDAVFLSTDTIWDFGIDLFIQDYKINGPLPSSAVYSSTKTTTIPNGTAGNYYVIVVSDYKEANNDSDRMNNYQVVRDGNGDPEVTVVTLTPPPDLRINSANIPSQGISGQPLPITYTVTNNGTGPTVEGAWTDKVYLSTDFNIDGGDQIIATISHSGNLAVGTSYTKSINANIPLNQAGNRIILIKTDNNNAVYEHLNEGNNVTTAPITITQPPPSDLIVSEIIAPLNAIAGTPITIDWKLKNIGDNPATGNMKEAVYLSTDATWDINDALLKVVDANSLNIAPQSEINRSVTAPLTGVSIGDYYAIIRTDILNNIFEYSDSNNTTAAIQATRVDVKELPLETLTPDSLFTNTELYYRIEIADTLVGETLLTTLKADSINGANELYLRYGNIPTRVEYDYVYEVPFFGNQEIVVPELLEGTYYLLAYGSSLAGSKQGITLLAEILDFEIRNVNANEGGNTGAVTVEINGSKFEETMSLRLENGGTPIVATNIYFVDPTRVYATFNLSGRALGLYDVVADKAGETATLVNGFTIVAGTEPSLTTNINQPSATRPGRVVSIQIEYLNDGNIDLINPTSILKSLAGAPIAFTPAQLTDLETQLDILMLEQNGPPNVLRPGASGIITVYAKADAALGFLLQLPDFD